MVIRQTSPRTERRRRVLTDDRLQSVVANSPQPQARDDVRVGRRYARGADFDQQPRVCDVIPQRAWSLLVFFLLQVTLWVALATAAMCYHAHQLAASAIDLTPLNLAATHSLVSGTILLTLATTTVYSWLVASFRRHKVDDYRGRYRVWYSAVGLFLLLLIARATGLQATLESLAVQTLAGLNVSRPGWWADILFCTAGLGFVVRLGCECWPCRGATITLGLAAAVALFGLGFHLEWWRTASGELQTVGWGLCELATYQLLLLSIVQYARFVLLDAQGLLRSDAAVRPQRKDWWRVLRRLRRSAGDREALESVTATRRATVAATNETAAPPSATDHDSQSPPSSSRSTEPEGPTEEDDDEVDGHSSGLNRADRKRLRKEQRRQRHAA